MRCVNLYRVGKAIGRFEWTAEQGKMQYDVRLLKILEPIHSVDPQLPELKEGSIIPRFNWISGAVDESHRHAVDVDAEDKTAITVLCTMPDVPVDSEYVH